MDGRARRALTCGGTVPARTGADARVPAAHPLWLWFLPSALFIVAAVTGSRVVDPTSVTTWAVAASLTLVAAATAGAVAVLRSGSRRFEVAVPTLLLAAAGAAHVGADVALASSILLAGMPAAWLAYEFGRTGAVVATLGIVVATAGSFLVGAVPTSPLQRWDAFLPSAALVSMAWVTHRGGRLLARARTELEDRTRYLERETATTRTLFESVDAALAAFLPDRVLVNGRAAHLADDLGIDLGRGTWGSSPTRVLDADGATPTVPDAQALVRAERGEVFSGLVQWMGCPDERRAMVCSSSLITAGDAVVGTVFTASDATEVIEAARVREEFLGTLTHELRTPLAAILGYVDLHSEAYAADPGAAARHLDGLRRNADALGAQIEDLLLAAQPAARVRTELVDVASLTRDGVAAYEDRARRAGLALTLSCPPALTSRVDASAFDQVLGHLLSNAVTYTAAGSVAVVLEGERGTEVEDGPDAPGPRGFTLTVADTGMGMSRQEASRVFDRFYRTEEAVSRVLPGLGIGLAVTKQLVGAHHGSITVSSEPRRGSTFRVTIPAARPA